MGGLITQPFRDDRFFVLSRASARTASASLWNSVRSATQLAGIFAHMALEPGGAALATFLGPQQFFHTGTQWRARATSLSEIAK
jgi:hypothetical protein